MLWAGMKPEHMKKHSVEAHYISAVGFRGVTLTDATCDSNANKE